MADIPVQGTDSTNVQATDNQVFDDPGAQTQTRPVYEVVFFAKYKHFPRPSEADLINYFSTYGEVHHVVCPMNAIFAFIFMTRLSTDAEQRRTRTTISQIIRDMDPNQRFHITVASNKRSKPRTNNDQPGQTDQSNQSQPSPAQSNKGGRGRNFRGRRSSTGDSGRLVPRYEN